MAQIPSQKEIDNIVSQNTQDHAAKADSQRSEGKSFNVPADGHGPGVVPETIWQAGKAAAQPAEDAE